MDLSPTLIALQWMLLLTALVTYSTFSNALDAHQNQSSSVQAEADQTTVFKAGDMGYACFRIPVLLQVPDALLAFVEARSPSCSDYHARSILLKRSEDAGHTWSEAILVSNVTHAETLSKGDGLNLGVALYQEPLSGETIHERVWLTWVECFHRCEVPYQYVQSSSDLGRTWAPPRDITQSIMALSKFSPGPGYGLHVKSFESDRLVMCGHYLRHTASSMSQTQSKNGSTLDTPYDISESGAACIYSDDFGGTWKSGVPVPYNSSLMSPDECQPVLISKYGNLLMTTRDERNSHHPLWTQSYDSGESWEEALVQTNLTSATCDTSMVAKNVTGKIRLFYSHPASTVRENMEVHWKNLNDDTPWTLLAKLWAGPAGYSCMTMMPLDNVGVLYENGEKSTYEKITFAKINYLAEQSAVHEEYSQKD
ncbi:sialidase-1-like isoform X3 [Sycon ciliatum]|uniref:sialidase-1-like isoform X3 n=1 Tax=Sycon ciliatum TaxID=27933 RepID=UPI0031F6A3F0